jgi:hypothetical protein
LATRGDCIDVAATDNDDIRCSFSNYGTWVDVSAPGWYIRSTYYEHTSSSHTYVWKSGTSMSAPHVVGLIGLLKSYYPSITAREIKQRIYHTTDNIDSLNSGYEGKLGSGRINAYKALALYWSSYSDSGHGTPCDDFDLYPEERTVFMHGASFLANHQYRVAYYDGAGDKTTNEEVDSDEYGNLSSQHTFGGAEAEETWHAIVCERAQIPPPTYDSNWEYIITDDTFHVDQSVIPEFPTALAAIAALALCSGIYLWMRRKAAPAPA